MSVLYVTAFKDIGRSTWNHFTASTHTYHNAFSTLARNLNVELTCFVDTDARAFISRERLLDEKFLHDYDEESTFFPLCFDKEQSIMNNVEYQQLVSHRLHHPEHCKPAYNIVNHNKVHFVRRASQLYPNYDTYVWIDFHQARHNDIPRVCTYNHLPKDKVTMCTSMHLFDSPNLTSSQITSLSCDHIQGSAFVVPKQMVNTLYDEYKTQLQVNYQNNIVDDDQGIHLAIHQRCPSLYNFIPARSFGYTIQLLQNDMNQSKIEDTISIIMEKLPDHQRNSLLMFWNALKDNWSHFTYMSHLYGMPNYNEIGLLNEFAIYESCKNANTVYFTEGVAWYTILSGLISSSSIMCDIASDAPYYMKKVFGDRVQEGRCRSSYDISIVSKCDEGIEMLRSDTCKCVIGIDSICAELQKHTNYAFTFSYVIDGSLITKGCITEFGKKVAEGYKHVCENRKTELCDIMTSERSDKGNGWHNYTIIYDHLFSELRNTPIALFEMGLGSRNPNIPSNMGVNGRPGASLYGWHRYFQHPQSLCWGADVDKDIQIEDCNIKTFFGDQLNKDVLQEMWNNIELRDKAFDIIIDDGLHEYEANANMFMNSYHKLKDNGVYIIEDIKIYQVHLFETLIRNMRLNAKFDYIALINLPNPGNTVDNIIMIIKSNA